MGIVYLRDLLNSYIHLYRNTLFIAVFTPALIQSFYFPRLRMLKSYPMLTLPN